MLINSAGSPLFIPRQEGDPQTEVFYFRYAITNWDMMQSDLISSLAFRFGTTTEELLAANPGLDLSVTVPSYLNIPVSGWRSIPPALVAPNEETVDEPSQPDSEPEVEEEPQSESNIPQGPQIPEGD